MRCDAVFSCVLSNTLSSMSKHPFQNLLAKGEMLFGKAEFANASASVELEVLDDGRWWPGNLVASHRQEEGLVHLVKCQGYATDGTVKHR